MEKKFARVPSKKKTKGWKENKQLKKKKKALLKTNNYTKTRNNIIA